MVNRGGSAYRELTVKDNASSPATSVNAMNVQMWERCLSDSLDREMGNIVETVENRIQNAVLTAMDNIIDPSIELVVKSLYASSG